jgi:uncharacterized protein YecE (DUF72 family)
LKPKHVNHTIDTVKKIGRIRIGTSNVVVPGNKASFPPAFRQRTRLHYYSTIFNTVEINSCFYKTPRTTTYEKWVLDVPEDFQFSLKLTRDITHAKELRGEMACVDGFMQSAIGVGDKRGCLLIQFPGKITLDLFNQVEGIMQYLVQLDPGNEWKKAVEFRNDTWYIRETAELMDEHGAALVLHDIPKGRLTELQNNADFVYIRFHGPKGDYRGSYTDEFLKAKAGEMQQWSEAGKDVYVYFNNTIGSAFENAVLLKKMLKQ